MEKLVQNSMRRTRWWLAGPSAEQTGRRTGSLANWFGVFLVRSWKGERHRGEWVKKRESGQSMVPAICSGVALGSWTHPYTRCGSHFLQFLPGWPSQGTQWRVKTTKLCWCTFLLHYIKYLQYTVAYSAVKRNQSQQLWKQPRQGQPSHCSVVWNSSDTLDFT